MKWTNNIVKFGFGFLVTLTILSYVKSKLTKHTSKVSLYITIDTMDCRVTYLVNSKPKHSQKGYLVLVNQGDTTNIKAYVTDSLFREIDCNTIIELDVNPN